MRSALWRSISNQGPAQRLVQSDSSHGWERRQSGRRGLSRNGKLEELRPPTACSRQSTRSVRSWTKIAPTPAERFRRAPLLGDDERFLFWPAAAIRSLDAAR